MNSSISNQSTSKYSNQWLEFWIKDGILFAKYHAGVYIDLNAAKNILAERLAYCQGKSFPSLVDSTQVKYWTREARAFMATPENNQLFKAMAILVNSRTAEVIFNYYLYFNKPSIPTKSFRVEAEALKWLQQFL